MSLKVVKTAAIQLGYKGKDGLVMEPRTILQGDDGSDGPDGSDEEINFGDQGRRETLAEKELLMWESIARTRHNQFEDLGELDNAVDDVMLRKEVEIPDAEKGAAGGSKKGSEGNVDGLPKEVGEVVRHEGMQRNVQGRIQETVEEVPSSQVEFQGALEVNFNPSGRRQKFGGTP